MYLKNAYFVDGLRPVLNAYLLEPVKCRCVKMCCVLNKALKSSKTLLVKSECDIMSLC